MIYERLAYSRQVTLFSFNSDVCVKYAAKHQKWFYKTYAEIMQYIIGIQSYNIIVNCGAVLYNTFSTEKTNRVYQHE